MSHAGYDRVIDSDVDTVSPPKSVPPPRTPASISNTTPAADLSFHQFHATADTHPTHQTTSEPHTRPIFDITTETLLSKLHAAVNPFSRTALAPAEDGYGDVYWVVWGSLSLCGCVYGSSTMAGGMGAWQTLTTALVLILSYTTALPLILKLTTTITLTQAFTPVAYANTPYIPALAIAALPIDMVAGNTAGAVVRTVVIGVAAAVGVLTCTVPVVGRKLVGKDLDWLIERLPGGASVEGGGVDIDGTEKRKGRVILLALIVCQLAYGAAIRLLFY
ncbi:hypothetical protein PYCC9005_001982 [Savitreella phatthalungensis]